MDNPNSPPKLPPKNRFYLTQTFKTYDSNNSNSNVEDQQRSNSTNNIFAMRRNSSTTPPKMEKPKWKYLVEKEKHILILDLLSKIEQLFQKSMDNKKIIEDVESLSKFSKDLSNNIADMIFRAKELKEIQLDPNNEWASIKIKSILQSLNVIISSTSLVIDEKVMEDVKSNINYIVITIQEVVNKNIIHPYAKKKQENIIHGGSKITELFSKINITPREITKNLRGFLTVKDKKKSIPSIRMDESLFYQNDIGSPSNIMKSIVTLLQEFNNILIGKNPTQRKENSTNVFSKFVSQKKENLEKSFENLNIQSIQPEKERIFSQLEQIIQSTRNIVVATDGDWIKKMELISLNSSFIEASFWFSSVLESVVKLRIIDDFKSEEAIKDDNESIENLLSPFRSDVKKKKKKNVN